MDHWPALADLPLVVEELRYGRLDPGAGFGEAHPTRLVRVTGAGHEGLGEDITLFLEPEGPGLALAGEWTLGSFCAHLDTLEQWPGGEPEFGDMARRFRNWAYESAALDLALAQAGRPLHEVLGREPRPVSYVNSFGMGDPDVVPKVVRRLERYPQLRFKLDVHALYAACEEGGLAVYGGGMGELGVARGQIQLLAAMFSPDGPNDIAPPGFNALEPAAGLPPSPLAPDPAPVGFRRNEDR
jgi:L-alanine-DL-glutamate epimerase-like enolase superfamily enzyme